MNEPKINKQFWLSAVSNTFQFLLGFILGVSLIAGGAAAAAYYYFKKVSSAVPQKPVYTSEIPETTESESNSTATAPEATPEATPETQSETQPETQETLPSGAYYATVTWSQGLSLRAEPSIEADRIGGIGYDAKILILEDSQDKNWQKVQLPWNKQEGWVKAGNVKKVSQ
jgi:hypothetical protein